MGKIHCILHRYSNICKINNIFIFYFIVSTKWGTSGYIEQVHGNSLIHSWKKDCEMCYANNFELFMYIFNH